MNDKGDDAGPPAERPISAAIHGERVADQLLADIYAGVLEDIGLDEIERAVASRYISIPAPRPSLREIVNWTVKFTIEKAANLGELREQKLVGKPARNAIYGTNEQAE